MAENKNYKDQYAEIGKIQITAREGVMITEEPEQLPEIFLPAEGIDKDAVFACREKELSKEQLDKAVAEQKVYYKTFMADYAPALQSERISKELTCFDWRVGTDADAADFLSVLRGEGDWEKVTIPHYGPPLGVATTYYRTDFELTQEELDKDSQWICFKGVDYKTHVYMNGALVGEHTGFFAPFEFEFTKQARVGKNTCVVVVENDFKPMEFAAEYRGEVYTGDKIYASTGLGYDEPLQGWHHCPPAMGIWQDVSIESRSDIFIHDIFVRPVSEEKAEVWVELYSTKVAKREITLDVSLYGQNFQQMVFEHLIHRPDLGAYDPAREGTPLRMERGLNYAKFEIDIPDTRLWDTTEPWLYQVQLRLQDEAGRVVDTGKRQFGMRFFEIDEECAPKGVFYLNGKKIKLRGINTHGREQRMVFLKDFDRLLEDYMLAKVGNINYIRITQRPVQPEVYDMCDKLGLLIQTDFPAFGCMRRNTLAEALKQMQEMEHLIRSHPCCIMVSYINERAPFGQSKPHRCVERHEIEAFFECADRMIHILNPDRVIKPIDGDYDPPGPYGLPDYHCYNCWYNGHGVDLGKLHKGYWLPVKKGWNYGCGEFGMEGMDTVALMRKYYPREWLPEHDEDEWSPITMPGDPPVQTGYLHHMFFETPKTIGEWSEASQAYQAMAMNFMVRAFRRDRKMMSYAYFHFIDAYPDGWLKCMVDYERNPKKAFWEYREASAPVMVDLRYDRFKVWEKECINIETRVCNDLDEEITDAKLHYQVYLEDELLLASKKEVTIPAFDVAFTGYLPVEVPAVKSRSHLRTQIALIKNNGEVLSTYEMELDVFPKEKTDLGKVHIIGNATDFEKQIKQAFEVCLTEQEEVDKDTTILIFDLDQYKRQEDYWNKLTEQGAKIIYFNLPLGVTRIAEHDIHVMRLPSKPSHFASRNTEHPLVSDFEQNDVRYWYDESTGYITPILKEIFEAEGFEAILTSVRRIEDSLSGIQGSCSGSWSKALAVARRQMGKGWICICQVDLQNRIVTNPVAAILFERLITMKESELWRGKP